jgi:hypothetical protein
LHDEIFYIDNKQPYKYWGFNPQVSNSNIHFVRGHSVYSIINENLFKYRLKQVDLGHTVFDLPPLVIFDQKLIYSLPFLKQTSHLFSDDIRDALVYTTVVFPTGFWDINGEFVSIDEFLKRPPKLRKYYLKYGGCDTSLNWGSRAVFRLDTKMASKQLQQATEDFKRSRPWIIQPALGEKEDIEYCSREEKSNEFKRFPAKYSTFYGPSGLYAVRSHHRQSTKVHGQPDAVVGLAY